MERDGVLEEIYTAVRRANELREPDAQVACAEDTVLYGPAGSLDSLGLVSLLMDVEEAVGTRAGTALTLTDEHAMSMHRNPFRTIGSLADYVVLRLNSVSACKIVH
jgi:hypothetical protein